MKQTVFECTNGWDGRMFTKGQKYVAKPSGNGFVITDNYGFERFLCNEEQPRFIVAQIGGGRYAPSNPCYAYFKKTEQLF